jgi:hypothetical protein
MGRGIKMSWVRGQDIMGRGSNYHEWGSIYQKRNKRPKGVKMRDLFFSENTGAIRTEFIRNVFSSIGISHTTQEAQRYQKWGCLGFSYDLL